MTFTVSRARGMTLDLVVRACMLYWGRVAGL